MGRSSSGVELDGSPTSGFTVVGRQAIFDAADAVVAHELLFRTVGADEASVVDPEQATSEVIVAAVTEVGLDELVGDRLAFVNIPRSFLLSGSCAVLPPERVVLEILEDVEPDDEVVAAVCGLAERGYRIALDDFEFRPEFDPLLEVAEIVKVDLLALAGPELERALGRIAHYGCTLLAEKVEDRADLPALREMGFELFQGYALERPRLVEGRRGETGRTALVQVLSELYRPDAEPVDVVEPISHDPTLSYALLRIVNSAAVRRSVAVSSLRQAVVLLGVSALRSWVTMLMLTRVVEGSPEALVGTLMRAKMCDLLAEKLDVDPSIGFTVGMLWSLPDLLGEPLPVLVERLPLDETVVDALTSGSGPYGHVLSLVLAYEARDEQELADLDAPPGLARLHLTSLAWARDLTTMLP